MEKEVIMIASGKGGVGKTVLTAALGAGLSMLGKNVVIIDADTGLRNLDLSVGLDHKIIYNLVDVCEGNCKLSDALLLVSDYEKLSFLPTAQTRDHQSISEAQYRELITELKKQFDYILFDCPSGMNPVFWNLVSLVDHAVLVTTPDRAAIRSTDRMIGFMEGKGLRVLDLIINKVIPELTAANTQMKLEEIRELLPINILGYLPEDPFVTSSNHQGKIILQNSDWFTYITDISKRLIGVDIPLSETVHKSGKKHFLWKLFHK